MLSRHLSQESSLADRNKIQVQTRNDPETDKIFHVCVCMRVFTYMCFGVCWCWWKPEMPLLINLHFITFYFFNPQSLTGLELTR